MAKKWLLSLERVSEKLQFKFGGVIHWANGVFNILEPNRQDNARMKVADAVDGNDAVTLSQLEALKQELGSFAVYSVACPFKHDDGYAIDPEVFEAIPVGALVKELNIYVENGSDEFDKFLTANVSLGSNTIEGWAGVESDSFNSYDVPRKEVTDTVSCSLNTNGLTDGSFADGYVELVYSLPEQKTSQD